MFGEKKYVSSFVSWHLYVGCQGVPGHNKGEKKLTVQLLLMTSS